MIRFDPVVLGDGRGPFSFLVFALAILMAFVGEKLLGDMPDRIGGGLFNGDGEEWYQKVVEGRSVGLERSRK